MCGRYALTAPQRLKSLFPTYRFPSVAPRYNVAPTQDVLALRNDAHGEAALMPWGMQGNINARFETVAEKPSFRDSLRVRRAVVFADGYYEWQVRPDGKQPYFIHLPDEAPFTFAALFDATGCTLITTHAAPSVASIHDRMTVILSAGFRERGLDERELDGATATELLGHPVSDLVARPVSTAVNKVANDVPALIARVEPPQQGDLFG